MSIVTWGQVVPTLFLGLVGLWLAHNYRRQVRLSLPNANSIHICVSDADGAGNARAGQHLLTQ